MPTHCERCGQPLIAGAQVCDGCGRPVADTSKSSLFCRSCGASIPRAAQLCPSCGRTVVGTSGASTRVSAGAEGRYAGFWRRLGAHLLDSIIIAAIALIPAIPVGYFVYQATYPHNQVLVTQAQAEAASGNGFWAGWGVYMLVGLVYWVVGWSRGGTWGMRAAGLSLVSTSTNGPPGFGSALVRYLVSVGSGMAYCLGYLWMLWDGKRQTWHDKAAGTVVLPSRRMASVQEYQDLLAKIERLAGRQEIKKALALCLKVIRDLRAADELPPEYRRCLGLAYLAEGQLLEDQGQPWAAAVSYEQARPFVPLPAAAVSFLAHWLIESGNSAEHVVDVCLDYLRLRQEESESVATDPVYVFLHDLCRVDEEATPEQCAKPLALNERVLEADTSLEWAHYYLGLALAKREDYAQAISHLETAEGINPDRKEAAYFAHVYRGILSEQKGERAEAVELFREASALIDERPEAHFLLAKALVAECEAIEERDEPDAPAEIARLAAAAVFSIARATSLRPDAAEYHFYHGRASSLAHDSPTAVDAYRRALDSCPEAKEYHLHLAIELGRLCDYEAALQATERALAADQSYADGYQVWGDLLAAEGRYDQAVEQYFHALALDPQHWRARLGLGRAFYHLGQLGNSIPVLDAVRMRSREAAYLLARCYSLTEEFASAVPLLSALTARPDASGDAFYYLGCAHANLQQFSSAIESLSACLRLEPTHWQAHLQRGHCYLATQEWEKGRTDYEQARALQPDNHDVALAFAHYHLMRGEEETARPYLEQVIQAQPVHWGANMMLGVLAERANDVPGAERAYLAALQAETNRAEPYARLGLLCCHQSRYQEACEHFQGMIQDVGANPKSTPAVLFHWGYARAMCADYGGALEVWRQLQQRCPEDQHLTLNVLRLHYLLGRQQAEAEKYEEAILAWEEFLSSSPDDEDLRKDIAELYFRMAVTGVASLSMSTESDFERVRADLNSAVQLNGTHPFAPFYLALCDLLDGPPARAAQALEGLCAGEPSDSQLRVMYHWGIALLRSGQNGRARDILRAVADHPLCAKLELPIYVALAVACCRTEQWEDALEALERLR